jgi:LytS/YehU family sensor histidine kinase
MNPHFLFNALNSVYFLIDKSNSEAREALHKFSDLMRYQLYEVKDQKIPIEKEIDYLNDYIAVQRLRRENIFIQINIDTGMKDFFIEPLLLIPFVENSFKHLSHFDNAKSDEINLDLSKHNGEMIFAIKNTKDGNIQSSIEEHGGIGLANVKRRLELLYPQRHELTIKNDNEYFDVQLKLKID